MLGGLYKPVKLRKKQPSVSFIVTWNLLAARFGVSLTVIISCHIVHYDPDTILAHEMALPYLYIAL